MSFFKRYDKNVIEEFALRVIEKSFDTKYASYISPQNTDNFDFISLDKKAAIEITTVIPENEMEAYVYEKQLSLGKTSLSVNRVSGAKAREDGTLYFYHGGSMQEIKEKIQKAILDKNKIAIKRKLKTVIETIDLCICVQDGGLFDRDSFELEFYDFESIIFENIFFITPSYFIRNNKGCGFEELPRII